MFKFYYLSLQGRCNRQQYWIYGVIPYAILWTLLILSVQMFSLGYVGNAYYFYPLSILSLWPLMTMQVKRYHDLDMSGWLVLLLLLPILGKMISIIVGVLPGKSGDNQYGVDLEGRSAQAVELRPMPRYAVFSVMMSGYVAYLVFATFTGLDDFGVMARNEERWLLWRYVVTSSWVMIAAIIYIARGQQAWLGSIIAAAAIGMACSMFVIVYFASGGDFRFAPLGSAMGYAFMTAMLCMTFKNLLGVIVSAVLFFSAQLIVDMIVLGVAAEVRLH